MQFREIVCFGNMYNDLRKVMGKGVVPSYVHKGFLFLSTKCNFLDYASIKNKILNLHISFSKYNNTRPILPNMLNIINLGGKGCKKIYNTIQKSLLT